MTLDKTAKYGTRFGDKNTNSPTGSYKNKSDSSTNDGSFLEQDWANDAYDGLNGAFLANVHDASTNEPQGYTEPTFPVTINGLVDNAQASQVYNAWYKKTQDVADGRIAAKQLEEKIAALETEIAGLETDIAGLEVIDDGCYFNWYAGDDAVVLSNSPNEQWVNFEQSPNPNATPTVITKNNFTLDTSTPQRLVFNRSGNYSIKIVMFAAVKDSHLSNEEISGKLKVFKNYEGSDSTTTDNLLFELNTNQAFVIHPLLSTQPMVVASKFDEARQATLRINGLSFVPVDFFNINKDDFLTINMGYYVGTETFIEAKMTMELSVVRVGKVTT